MVDQDGETDAPWDQWLLLLQGFAAPQFVLLVLWLKDVTPSPLFPSLCCLSGSTIFTVFVFSCSESLQKPHWFPFLGAIGFVISAFWIAIIAEEVVSILKMLGVVFEILKAVLVFTVFAIGNSIDDLVANTTVAQHGHPLMALSTCFAGPLLNILISLGISGSYVFL